MTLPRRTAAVAVAAGASVTVARTALDVDTLSVEAWE